MATPTAYVTDSVIASIEANICSRLPERGGALLEASGIQHVFVPDEEGQYTSGTWDISPNLTAEVNKFERAGNGTWCGVLHSHPVGFHDPSTGDLQAAARMLDLNSHLDSLWLFIVTAGAARPTDLQIDEGRFKISAHRVSRGPAGNLTLVRSLIRVIPLGQDMNQAGLASVTGVAGSDITDTLLYPIGTLPGGQDGVVGFTPFYPLMAPIFAIVTDRGLVPVDSPPWSVTRPSGPQLKAAVAAVRKEPALGHLDRVAGLTSGVVSKHVLVAGLGSVGSQLLNDLARVGVEKFTLLDPELVDGPNVTRSWYNAGDVGLAKVAVSKDKVLAINPRATVDTIFGAVQDVQNLEELCANADLIVAAADEPIAQAMLNHAAYWMRTNLISPAIYKQANAGEIVVSAPSAGTACLSCATGGAMGENRPEKDYATGRLVGELALGPSIHLICEVASIIAIGLLSTPGSPAAGVSDALIDSGLTIGLVSTIPEWNFFPELFGPIEKFQLFPQSVWMSAKRSATCPVCGPEKRAPVADFGAALTNIFANLRNEEPPEDCSVDGATSTAPASPAIQSSDRQSLGDEIIHLDSVGPQGSEVTLDQPGRSKSRRASPAAASGSSRKRRKGLLSEDPQTKTSSSAAADDAEPEKG